MPSDPASEIARLREQIRYHDGKYHGENAPEISDLEYDRLVQRLKALEEKHPKLVTPDSPTQRIGDRPVEGLEEVRHRVPMLSIDNTYSIEELRNYADRTQKLLPDESIEWVVELKIDGVAVCLIYEDGLLVRGVTRGNGRTGDDVTHNIRTVGGVPLRLSGENVPPVLEVRGEVYMTNSDLVRLNEVQQRKGEAPFANTRNVTAGSIRLLDPKICAGRRLRFFGHGVGYAEGLHAASHSEFLDEVRGYGLPVTPQVECFGSFDAAVEHCEGLIERLHELDFEIDGLVLKVNRFDQRERLGSTSKSPRWLIAYKFEKYEATTRLNEIRVQIGKTGAVTPVAELEPVQLAGTTVSRASLHNADEIERKDVREGDVVVVEKAGKIIPHVVRVEKHERKGQLKKFVFPKTCPECNTRLVRDTIGEKDEPGVYIRCPNHQCPAQVKERIQYFASRNAMDIEGLGDELIDHLVDDELVRNYADLFRLTVEDLTSIRFIHEWGVELAEKLLRRIEESKGMGMTWLIPALGIPNIGKKKAEAIAKHFPSMEALAAASVEELRTLSGLSERDAIAVHDFVNTDPGRTTLEELASVGVNVCSKTYQATTDDAAARRSDAKPTSQEGRRRKSADGVRQMPLFSEETAEETPKRIVRFAEKIKDLGKTRVVQLVNEGLVRTCGDLFRLSVGQLAPLTYIVQISEDEARNLLRNTSESKSRGLARLLNALSIRHVGARVAAILADHFGSMSALRKATVEQIAGINEIGSIIAESVYEFLHEEFGSDTVDDLRSLGVRMEAVSARAAGEPAVFQEKTFVVTGTLSRYTRDEIHELIERYGGRTALSVSSKTDYLVAGEKAGSKLAKAQKLGVPVLGEEEFEQLLEE